MPNSRGQGLDDLFQHSQGEAAGEGARSALQLLIALRISAISRQWTARAARLFKTSGYTPSQRAPLYLLRRAPMGMTQAELAKGLDLSEPTLSRQIGRLLREGLVSKHRLLGDGRANLIKLEPRGQQALERSDRIAADDRNLLFRGLSNEDLGTTLRVLDTLSARIPDSVEGLKDSGEDEADG